MKIDDALKRAGQDIQTIEAPKDLEERLIRALDRTGPKRRRGLPYMTRVAAVLIFFMLFGYHYNTLAYYGRRFVGFDAVVDGPIQELNELGKGQIVDETYTFSSGHTATLDGIMWDGNQLLAFCTLTSPHGDLDQVNIDAEPFLLGTWGRYFMSSGAGTLRDDAKEMKYVYSFSPPRFWEKTFSMAFTYHDGDLRETGKIRFVLDRQKAMGFSLRVQVQQSFFVGDNRVFIHSLQASPTQVRVDGSMQGILGLVMDTLAGERFRPQQMDLQLLVNGQPWEELGGGLTTDHRGISFHHDYEALPDSVESLELRLVSFQADYDVDLAFPLTVGEPVREEVVLGYPLQILETVRTDNGTYVTISSPDHLRLTRVHLVCGEDRLSLENTTEVGLEKTADGTIFYTRTLYFPGTGDDPILSIQRATARTVTNQSMPLLLPKR